MMRRLFWPVVGYAVVIGVVFGRSLLPGAAEMIWGDDIHRQYYFYRQFFNSFLKEGIWPWWNPYNFAGVPFMANPIVNIWYPPTWLFVFLPLNIAYSWHIALHILWAMMGMHRLISNFKFQISNLGTNARKQFDIGAFVGGLVFGLSGFFAARIWAGHVDVIAAASWMPWVVYTNVKCQMSRRRQSGYGASATNVKWKTYCVLAAAVFALQLLAGYQTMAFMTAIAVLIVTLLLCYFVKSFKPLVRMALAVALGLGLAAIQIIPLQEFFRQSIRTFNFPYSWNSYGSLTIASLKQFLNPFFFGDQISYHGPPPNFAEHAFFVGRVGVVLIIFFLLRRLPRLPRSPMVLAFGCVAFFGLWISLGPNAPIDLQYLLWKIVPMYRYLRLPPRHLILVVFGLSGLIGLGLQRFNKPFSFLIALFISAEMILYARHFIVLKPIPETRHDAELITLLKQDKEPYRVLTNFGAWIPPRDSFDFDAGANYRVFNATGYDPSILRSYYEFIDIANGNAPGASILAHDVQVPYLNVFSPATDFLNIKYILVPRAYDPLAGASGQASSRFRLIREDVSRDYRLYENKNVKPRFYIENGSAAIEKYSPNEIVLTTDVPKDATMVSSEVFYPGWEGFVDGKKVDVIKTNNAFRALFVPAGRHTVTYRYSPRIFLVGGVVSLASLGIACYIFFRSMSSTQSNKNS